MLSHPEDAGRAGKLHDAGRPIYSLTMPAGPASKEWLRRGHPPNSCRAIPLRSQKRKDRFLPANNCEDNKQQSCESLVAAMEREERRSEKEAQEV